MIASTRAGFDCEKEHSVLEAAEREMFSDVLSCALTGPEGCDGEVLRLARVGSAAVLAGIEAAWRAGLCGGSRASALEAFTNRVLGEPEPPIA